MFRTLTLALGAGLILGGCAATESFLRQLKIPTKTASDRPERADRAERHEPVERDEPSSPEERGLSEYGERFLRYVDEIKAACPFEDGLPGSCKRRQRGTTRLGERVEDTDPRIQAGRDYLVELGAHIEASDARQEKREKAEWAARQRQQERERVLYRSQDLMRALKQARAGEATSTMVTTFGGISAGSVQASLTKLQKQMDAVAQFDEECATDDSEECGLIRDREALFKRYLALQFDLLRKTHLKRWYSVVERVDEGKRVAVVNWNGMRSTKKLKKKVGPTLKRIAEVLGQSKGGIAGGLKDLDSAFKRAVKKQSRRSAWRQEAKGARYRDKNVRRAARRSIRGAKVIKAKATEPSWSVVRNAVGIPVEKRKSAMVLVKLRGEKHCRLYPVTMVRDHLGGGRYSKPHLNDGNVAEFWVSACR